MGTEDPGESSIQPPPRRGGRNDKPSSSRSIVSQEDCANLHRRSTSDGHRSTPTHQSSHVDPIDAFARMPAPETEDGKASVNSYPGTRLLDVETLAALRVQETISLTQASQPNSVPETFIDDGTNPNNADTRPPLHSGRRRARFPGVERIGRRRPDLPREDSNDSFGGNTIVPDEQPIHQQDALIVQAHLVQDQDPESNGPVAVAKPMVDTKGNTKRHVVIFACVLVVAAVAIGLGIGISLSTHKSGSSQNSSLNNETSIVATFVQMLPEFISPKSQAALSNPLSAPNQALSWIESLPIHNTMTIERLKQRYALASLYYSTGDQLWCNSDSWLTASDECTWFSSSNEPVCSDGVYINFDLSHNCLQNVIPDDIFLLSSLRTLDLSGNTFATDGFPETILRLTSLTALSIQSIGVNGTFPAGLKDLSNLESLDISFNYLSGNIENIVSMTGLKAFDCSSNRFTGTIPTEIGRLSNLVMWSCSSNYFENLNATEWGASTAFHAKDGFMIIGIPSEIGNLSNLRSLDMSSCHISGTIPSEIGQLWKLESLNLVGNELTGTIPDEIFAITNLEQLDLTNNKLTGSLSSHVDLMVNLRYLNLDSNLFEGALPAQIGNATSLRQLGLSMNQFNGTLPSSLGNLDQLLYLDLSTNRFVGSIPTEMGRLVELFALHLDFNSLTGTVPTEFGSLWNLTDLTFANTTLTDPRNNPN